MPRYYFHTANGTEQRDEAGAELPNPAEAKRMAVTMFGDIVSSSADAILTDRHMHLCLSDENGLTMMELTLVAAMAPATDVKAR